jgi:hydroxymethylpyrimidine/phosphomethylpyrimidine kinase
VYLLTPNYNEIKALFPEKTIEETIKKIAQHSNLYLKGGHRLDKLGTDQLFTQDGKQFTLNPKTKRANEKHGSGCILSSAITSYLAHDFPILKACFRGKRYTERTLESNNSLLAFHKL